MDKTRHTTPSITHRFEEEARLSSHSGDQPHSFHNLAVFKRLIREAEMADRKAVIKNADMSEDMQQDAVDCASQALEKYNIEKVSGRAETARITPHLATTTESQRTNHPTPTLAGHRCLYQEGVRQEVQPHLALHSGKELWLLRHARDKALHILLPRPSSHLALQVRLSPARSVLSQCTLYLGGQGKGFKLSVLCDCVC
jgi:hypothetical protein